MVIPETVVYLAAGVMVLFIVIFCILLYMAYRRSDMAVTASNKVSQQMEEMQSHFDRQVEMRVESELASRFGAGFSTGSIPQSVLSAVAPRIAEFITQAIGNPESDSARVLDRKMSHLIDNTDLSAIPALQERLTEAIGIACGDAADDIIQENWDDFADAIVENGREIIKNMLAEPDSKLRSKIEDHVADHLVETFIERLEEL